ncbi:rab-GTPase-TBC domain-containing protein [Earliella scabrosa]|nr:rab-GTPase-TBC domain-containing protein [Earliella scabrosa]
MEDGETEKAGHLEDAVNVDWQAYRLLSLQPHGFGAARVHIWPRLLNVNTHDLEDKREATDCSVWSEVSLTQTLEEQDDNPPDGEPHKDERQIELDTDRSFVLYPVEGVSSREKLQTALNRLIVSIFRRRPRLHYFQGYHDIVSVIFLTLPKELHRPVVEKLSLHRVRDSMGINLDPVVGLLRYDLIALSMDGLMTILHSILQRLLRLADPKFAAILDRTAPLPYFALSNLLTLFSHDVPTLPLIQHIFDYLLCRPPIAVVYLAAALTLTRRQEAQVLEDEGEEGMMHSLLTVLPDLYEEGELEDPPVKVEAPTDSPAANEITTIKAEAQDVASTSPPPGASPSPDAPDIPSSSDQAGEDGHIQNAPADPQTASAGTHEPNADAGIDSTTASPVAGSQADGAEPAIKDEPQDMPLPVDGNDDDDDKKPLHRTSSPEPLERETRPHRPRISVTALLRHADELFALYPPSHPSIALASVMGPQSVMLTWSERASDLPDDDDAERMVARPELIVLPYVEHESDDDESEKGRRRRGEKEERERRRRRLRKPRRLTDIVVQRKTMVAGAVLVLGVAMAVYGLNGGLPGAGGGHHRGGFGKEWRKVGRLLGGIVGAGGKVFDGIRRGLE